MYSKLLKLKVDVQVVINLKEDVRFVICLIHICHLSESRL